MKKKTVAKLNLKKVAIASLNDAEQQIIKGGTLPTEMQCVPSKKLCTQLGCHPLTITLPCQTDICP